LLVTIYARTEFRHGLAVDFDAALQDYRFGFSPAGNPGRRKYLVQPLSLGMGRFAL